MSDIVERIVSYNLQVVFNTIRFNKAIPEYHVSFLCAH